MSAGEGAGATGPVPPWGRVDEAGTVWVRTADGEREVGSYPGAGDEAALAYFTRKYDELAGQVRLLEARVRGTGLSPAEAQAGVTRLRAAVTGARAVGDLDALLARLDALAPKLEERSAALAAAKASERQADRTRKEALVAEAETLAGSTSWKSAGDRLRALVEEWKAAPRLERRVDDELWKRFSAARSTFDRNRRQHFSSLDAQRGEAKDSKAKIVAEAEALKDSTEWGATAARYRDLMTAWKASPRAGKADEEALWERFRAAQDAFFAARNATMRERDSEQRANLTAKSALAREAEALLPVTDVAAARRALRELHERWEAIGHVPRESRAAVEGRLKAVEDAVNGAEESSWRRSNPEARARAEATVAQLETTIAKLEAERASAQAGGDARKVADADAALQARSAWLAEARKVLAEVTG